MWGILARMLIFRSKALLKSATTVHLFAVIAVIGAMLTPHTAAEETLYRWTNERGNPVNSDRPPPTGTDYEVISTGSTLVRKVAASKGAVPLDIEPSPSNDFEQVDTAEPKIEKNALNCERARDNLTQIETHARIRMRNNQGEVYYLSEEQKVAEKEKTLAAIETYC